MKKTILLVMLFVSTAMAFTSCKKDKDPKPSEKERVTELLLSGKWYYNSSTFDGRTRTCYWEAQYWEFKSDGTFTETGDEIAGGTYTVSQDGKSITFTPTWAESPVKTNSFTISATALSFAADFGGGPFSVTLSKTAGGCAP